MSKVDEITKEQALKLVDTLNEDRNNLKIEKQQLISFLEEKIKHLENIIHKSKIKPYGEELRLLENSLNRYKDVLDFVNKGGKDE